MSFYTDNSDNFFNSDDDFDPTFLNEHPEIPLKLKKAVHSLLQDKVGTFLAGTIGEDLGSNNQPTPQSTHEEMEYIFNNILKPYIKRVESRNGVMTHLDAFKLAAFLIYGSINILLHTGHEGSPTGCSNPLCQDCYPSIDFPPPTR
jgi:hypothetical protein